LQYRRFRKGNTPFQAATVAVGNDSSVGTRTKIWPGMGIRIFNGDIGQTTGNPVNGKRIGCALHVDGQGSVVFAAAGNISRRQIDRPGCVNHQFDNINAVAVTIGNPCPNIGRG